MRKNFGVKTWAYPMPVFIVAAYDKDGKPCCMNAAWGGIYDTNQIMVCLADDHKTTKNILESGAFLRASAVDELSLVVASVIAEKQDKPLFYDSEICDFELMSAQDSDGVLILNYKRK